MLSLTFSLYLRQSLSVWVMYVQVNLAQDNPDYPVPASHPTLRAVILKMRDTTNGF